MSSRAERVAQAQELRAEGLKLREISERMGVSTSTASEYLCDPDLSQHRERRYRRSGTCIDCGAKTDASRPEPSKRCARCARAVAARVQREYWAAHKARIEQMWRDGMTGPAISAAVGSVQNISNLRRRGYDLPRRRTPEQIARITADGGAHLAKARAAKVAA